MKKLLCAMFLGMSLSSMAIDGHLRLGGITNAKSYKGKDTAFESYAPTVGFEISQSLLLFDVGAGVAYNGKTGGSEIATVPAYVMAKYNIIPLVFKPYIVAKVGRVLYTDDKVNDSNPEGTYYYGAGVGVNFAMLQGEILYSNTKIKKDKRGNGDLGQVSLVLGYQFF